MCAKTFPSKMSAHAASSSRGHQDRQRARGQLDGDPAAWSSASGDQNAARAAMTSAASHYAGALPPGRLASLITR